MTNVLSRLAATLRSDDRVRVRLWACALAAASFAVYMSNGKMSGSWDTKPARYLPCSIVHEFNMDFNEFPELYKDGKPYFLTKRGEKYLSAFPVMAGILAVPVHIASHLFPGADSEQGLRRQEKIAAALIASASVACVFLAAREIASGPAAFLVTLVYAFCTSTFSTSSQGLWQHGPSELFLALGSFLLLRSRRNGRLWPVGASLGMAVLCRPTNAIAVILFGLYILLTHPRQVFSYALGGLPVLVLGVWLNAPYGHPFGAYSYHDRPESWASPLWSSLAGHLVSPSRGLLIFSPVLAFCAQGLWRKLLVERDGVFACMAAFGAIHLMIISKFSNWWAGFSFGSRFTTDLLPFAVLFLVPVAERVAGRFRVWPSVPFVALALVSFAIHAGGVYRPGPMLWNMQPSVNLYPIRVWQWWDSQALAAFYARPARWTFEEEVRDPEQSEWVREATYRWCRRIAPTGSPVTVSFPLSLRPRTYALAFRARAWRAGAGEGPAGELVLSLRDGTALARITLPGAPVGTSEFTTQRATFTVPSGSTRAQLTYSFTSSGNDTIWLDHIELR